MPHSSSRAPDAEDEPGDRTAQDLDGAAAEVVAWLRAREETEYELGNAAGKKPSQRDATVARMADVLQAVAHGLGQEAAAVWAGVPYQILQTWLDQDAAFATAVASAASLADVHGLRPGGAATPAMVRVAVLAISQGQTWQTAARSAGLTQWGFRQLLSTSPAFAAMTRAARKLQPRRSKHFVPASYRPRRPGRPTSLNQGYRLVRMDDPVLSPPPTEED
ncbi:hypothetical protein [Actinacidiphila glaucinigra]|uniref:hypothetical protein n=1 Tax=Actinacidiphila glaucinigra TaxID=235986 RepID=UPI0035E26F2A